MAFGGPNPGIWGESVRKALNPDDERDAHDHDADVEQALLDKAELQELERSELYGETLQDASRHDSNASSTGCLAAPRSPRRARPGSGAGRIQANSTAGVTGRGFASGDPNSADTPAKRHHRWH